MRAAQMGLLLLALVSCCNASHRKAVRDKNQELKDLTQLRHWTINTVYDEYDPFLWKAYKERFKIHELLSRLKVPASLDPWLWCLWIRRVQWLKAKHECGQYVEKPYPIDGSTVMPIRDKCENDPFMCANKPKDQGRREYDTYLKDAGRKHDLIGFGKDGFNIYSIRKSIYMLRLERNGYLRCIGSDVVTMDEDFDQWTEKEKKQVSKYG